MLILNLKKIKNYKLKKNKKIENKYIKYLFPN